MVRDGAAADRVVDVAAARPQPQRVGAAADRRDQQQPRQLVDQTGFFAGQGAVVVDDQDAGGDEAGGAEARGDDRGPDPAVVAAAEEADRVVLKGENAKLTVLPRADIEEMKIEEKSLMPEGLPNTMTEQQFRDLIAYLLEEPYLTRGLIAGPFKMALDTKGPVETSADPLKTDGVTWKPFALGPTGIIDMGKLGVLAPPTDSTAYVYLEVVAPRAVQTALEVAADDDVKVWLNGKEVHRRTRAVEPRRVPIELKEGTNRLLLKVHNVYGVSFVAARLSDPERVVEVRELKAP